MKYITETLNILDWCSNLWMLYSLGCIAVWKPKGVQIAKKYLQNCFHNNKEGAGFAISKDGKISMEKGFFTFDEFWKVFQPLQKHAAVIHFRIATHGEVDVSNCHPFIMADGKYALVHNGILPSSLHSNDKKQSDTKQFAALIEPLLAMVPFEHPEFTRIVGECIGYNKIAILREDGKAWLFNEGKGEWHNGAWYSNTGYSYGAVKRVINSVADSTQEFWQRLRQGERPQIVYSSVHGGNGFWTEQGEWRSVGSGYYRGGYYSLAGDWVPYDATVEETAGLTPEEEQELAELHAAEEREAMSEAAATKWDDNWEREPTDEELAHLETIQTRAELDGDIEFMPETEQERIVQRWLALKSKQILDANRAKVIEVDSGNPDAVATAQADCRKIVPFNAMQMCDA